MYRVCRVSVSSFKLGVRSVELWLRVCCEWGVMGDREVEVSVCSFIGGLGGEGVNGGVMS